MTTQAALCYALSQEEHLLTAAEQFLHDGQARGLRPGTMRYYSHMLRDFAKFCESQAIASIRQVEPATIRDFMLSLQSGHNPGGCHAHFRALKAFLRWWEAEFEPADWKNPVRKIRPPKVALSPLAPVSLVDVRALLKTCETKSLLDLRDKAIFLVLIDTGLRASELVALDRGDVDHLTGAALIRCGKGGKSRMVYLGSESRKALRRYLSRRRDEEPALFVSDDQERLTYWGLRQIVRRRSGKAGIEVPGLHDFRRAFALESLRSGMDVMSLQRLLGHSDLSVLRRYLAQNDNDVRAAHAQHSPGDKL